MNKRALGIDYGLARIGISISDERKIIASPWIVIQTEKKIEKTAEKIANEITKIENEKGCSIDEIVIGMPWHMNGRIGVLADEVQLFVRQLETLVSIPIITWDERLTSAQAERALRESNMTRKKRTKSVDLVAATIILQNYLDSKSFQDEVS